MNKLKLSFYISYYASKHSRGVFYLLKFPLIDFILLGRIKSHS